MSMRATSTDLTACDRKAARKQLTNPSLSCLQVCASWRESQQQAQPGTGWRMQPRSTRRRTERPTFDCSALLGHRGPPRLQDNSLSPVYRATPLWQGWRLCKAPHRVQGGGRCPTACGGGGPALCAAAACRAGFGSPARLRVLMQADLGPRACSCITTGVGPHTGCSGSSCKLLSTPP